MTASEEIIDRPAYKMKYYSDCIMDTSDEDFDLDSYFTINTSSNSGSTSFFIYDTPIDEQVFLDAQLKSHHDRVIKNGTITYFDTWGKYKGHGAIISGKLLGVMKGEVKVFVHSCEACTFLTVYQIYNSDREQDMPCLQLIEQSFEMK